jgi:hypothetical protein
VQLPHLGKCESHRTLRSKQKSAHYRSYGSLSTLHVFTSASPTPFYCHGEILDCQSRLLIFRSVETAGLLSQSQFDMGSTRVHDAPWIFSGAMFKCHCRVFSCEVEITQSARRHKVASGQSGQDLSATKTKTRQVSEKVAYDDEANNSTLLTKDVQPIHVVKRWFRLISSSLSKF